MATYKTKDGVDRIVPGVGRTVNGLITTSFKIENSMFELVPDEAPAAPAPVSQPQPAAAQPPTDNKETK